MAKNTKEQTEMNGSGGTDIVRKCLDEKCAQKGARAGFCNEHFGWFKEGLLTTQGERPKDFDKKYQAFMNRQRKAS